MKLIEKIKERNFWINLVVFFGFVLPLLITFVGFLGYELLNIEFMSSLVLAHWFVLFGLVYGLPAIAVIMIVFYFLEKGRVRDLAPLTKENPIDKNREESKSMGWVLKFVIWFMVVIFILLPLLQYIFLLFDD